jgi:ABC-type bacteriocin/lantibiotic exporter with double-glycine peptidase domain
MAAEPFRPNDLDGFRPFDAALRLLQAIGEDAEPAKIREKAGDATTDEDIPALLETGEHRGRLVQINAEDIGLLTLPTLVQLKDGGWILVHAKTGKKWDIETRKGQGQIQLDQEHISGKAIDRLGVLPCGKSLWTSLGRLFLSHRNALGQILAVSVLMQSQSMVSPLITQVVMDYALPQASPSLLTLAVLGVLLTTIASSSLGLIREWTGAFVETRLEIIAQRGILEHTLKLPFPKLMRRTAGEIVQAFSGLSIAKDLLGQRLFGTSMDAITACAYLMLILGMWPMGAAIIVGLGAVLALVAFGSGLAQARIQRQAIPVQIAERDSMLQMLNGVATVKAAGAEGRSIGRWWKQYAKVQVLGLRRQRVGLWSEVGLDSIQLLVTLVLLVEGGRRVSLGELSIGTLFAVQQMGGSLTNAVAGAANLFVSFIVAKPQMEKAQEILSLEPEPEPPTLPVPQRLG